MANLTLKERLQEDRIIVAPGAFDMVSAKIIENSGFDALYVTGFGHSASHLGLPDAGFITLTEIVEIASLLEGKRISSNTELWIATTDSIRSYAEKMGYDKIIADAGGKIMADTCPCISQIDMARNKRYMTNSVKQAYYAPGQLGAHVHFANVTECIETALKGRRGA